MFLELEDIKAVFSRSDQEVENEYLGFFLHMDYVNLKLQGKGKLSCELLSEIKCLKNIYYSPVQ